MTTLYVDENFLMSKDAIALRDLARCGNCLTGSASDHAFRSLTQEEAANLQWVRCAQCRSGTVDWYRH
jgi:hypothetical protein